MPTRAIRRLAAPVLVVAGAALFGLGAGAIGQVDARLQAAAQTVAPAPQRQAPGTIDTHPGVRTLRPHSHRREL